MSEDSDEPDDWSGYESGPFCRHWGDPLDCSNMCGCGHRCCDHCAWSDETGDRDACCECACAKFTDDDATTPIGITPSGEPST